MEIQMCERPAIPAKTPAGVETKSLMYSCLHLIKVTPHNFLYAAVNGRFRMFRAAVYTSILYVGGYNAVRFLLVDTSCSHGCMYHRVIGFPDSTPERKKRPTLAFVLTILVS